ncbi:hypothetical protein BDV59DRAFT_177493 [Aspergillus ambiguus]|uniref:sulfotransferase family protein n=1 Tax=Aspergillus ambiguus TaxID=176160 RepID=UPI003CCE2744
MSREIDKLPEPSDRKKKWLIIASCSRTGTLSLYCAVKTLGYHPYHFAEMVMNHGASHMRIMSEAVVANNNPFSGIKRYNREDIDKWLANYDCLIEVPSYLGTRVFEEYATDPDIKFILTERDPDAWVKSVNNTAGDNVKIASNLPTSILKYFHKDLRAFFRLNQLVYWVLSDTTNKGDTSNEANLRRNYVE